jgi:hypothetical protein
MKRWNVIFVLTVLFCANVFASGGGGGGGNNATQNQAQSAQQAQGQSQNASNAGIGNSENDLTNVGLNANEQEVKINSNYVQKTQPITPSFPQGPFMFPSDNQVELWNAPPFRDMNDYEKVWTMEEVNYILGQAKEKGPLEGLASFVSGGAKKGYGFKGLITARKKVGPVNEIKVIFVGNPNHGTIEGYSWLGDGNIMGKYDSRTFELTFAYALKLAMKKGASLAVFTTGMNGVNKGQSSAAAPGVAGSGVNNSYSIIGGIFSSEATVRGEPVIRMKVYYQNGGVVSLGSATRQPFQTTPTGVRVNPEVLRKASDMN